MPAFHILFLRLENKAFKLLKIHLHIGPNEKMYKQEILDLASNYIRQLICKFDVVKYENERLINQLVLHLAEIKECL